jgi:TRAP-type C4-dicarboxylate transport system substrate-binding protein
MKKALVLSMVLVFATAARAQNWFKGTLDEAVAKAKTENKLVVLDFYSAG